MKYHIIALILLLPILLSFRDLNSDWELNLSAFKEVKTVKIVLYRFNVTSNDRTLQKIDSMDVDPRHPFKWDGKDRQPFVGFFQFYDGAKNIGGTQYITFSNDKISVTSKISNDNQVSFHVLGGENVLYNDKSFLSIPEKRNSPYVYTRRNFYLRNDLDDATALYEKNILDSVKRYPKYYTTAFKLLELSSYLGTSVLEQCYNTLDESIKITDAGKCIASILRNSKTIIEGKLIPELEILTIEDKKILLNDTFQEKFYFIEFWASWCVPCRQGFKDLREIYSKVDTNKIQFLTISIDENEQPWIKARNEENLPWQDYLQSSNKLSEIFGLTYIPQSVIINGKREMIERNLTKQTLNEFLIKHKLLKPEKL